MNKIKVLMFGWEFPPFNSGGLGVACEGLTRALSQKGVEIIFVLPKKLNVKSDFCRLVFASGVETIFFNSLLSPYANCLLYQNQAEIKGQKFENNLLEEVKRYALWASRIALKEKYDLIHAHDWLSFPAALEAKKIFQKPLITQIHATEFDRTGGLNINGEIYEIERQGMLAADVVVAVSNFTKDKIIKHYGIDPYKVKIVYNAVDHIENQKNEFIEPVSLKKNSKLVLFLGRITLQKGPDYFLLAAKEVLKYKKDVFFIVAGDGDMKNQAINQAIELGIADKVIFTGFLRGEDLSRIYQSADIYVLPSVSEPFGITALEALNRGTAVLVSRQSGASEIINHCLKVDFWDIKQMANKILAVLNYAELSDSLKENGFNEAKKFSWSDAASKCVNIYQELLK